MDFDKLKELKTGIPGFATEIGIEFIDLKEGYAKMRMPIKKMHKNPLGTVHGGASFSLADTVGGFAAITRGRYVTTVTGSVNYLNPATQVEELIGEAREIKAGRNICVYEVTVTDELGNIIMVSTLTYYYLDKKVVI